MYIDPFIRPDAFLTLTLVYPIMNFYYLAHLLKVRKSFSNLETSRFIVRLAVRRIQTEKLSVLPMSAVIPFTLFIRQIIAGSGTSANVLPRNQGPPSHPATSVAQTVDGLMVRTIKYDRRKSPLVPRPIEFFHHEPRYTSIRCDKVRQHGHDSVPDYVRAESVVSARAIPRLFFLIFDEIHVWRSNDAWRSSMNAWIVLHTYVLISKLYIQYGVCSL